MLEKSELRKVIKNTLKEAYKEYAPFHRESTNVCQKFLASEIYKNSSLILAYLNLKYELDVQMIIQSALKDGKTVAVPRVVIDTNLMNFYILDKTIPLEQQWETGAFNIREPVTTLKKLSPEHFDFQPAILVPGIAFSKDGKRLGRGKGFYDKYISGLLEDSSVKNKPILCGICLPEQIVEDIPCENHDIKMNYMFY